MVATNRGRQSGLIFTPEPGTLETRTFTIGADTDCFTDKTSPIAAELITGDSFISGKSVAG